LRVRAILNPRAGLKPRVTLEVLRHGHARWQDLELCLTASPGHARELARESSVRGDDLVLAVGGDGTANEVASGLMGSATPLGIVPAGSGNGLARTLRIPLSPTAALRALANGVVRRMDVGLANGEPFLNVAGAGLDAAVGADFHAYGKSGGRRGVGTYVRLSLRRALTYTAARWRLEAAGEVFDGPALIVAFLNGRQYGAGAIVAPRARLDDGILDVVVFEDAPLSETLLHAPRLFFGTIDRYKRYRHTAAASAVLTGEGPFAHHRDGEPEAAVERLDIGLAPRALRILVPRATAEDSDGPFGAVGSSD
jgi:diacylglycerol kinase (ATP)